MKKVAIITDSNSGISQEQAQELGVYVVPMPFTIGGKEFFEGINLSQEQFYEKLLDDEEISTSQPSPVALMELWDKLLKEYEELVYIPMSSGLSGSCQTAAALAADYEGRIQVVDNQRISVTLKSSVLDALAMAEQGMDTEILMYYDKKERGLISWQRKIADQKSGIPLKTYIICFSVHN